jgi:hypothetical protein
MIEYRYLTDIDIPKLVEFFTKSTTSEKASDWMIRGLTDRSTDIVIAAEIVNGNINGIVCGCTITYWVNAKTTFLPIWLAVRMDRLPASPTSFSSFRSCPKKKICTQL